LAEDSHGFWMVVALIISISGAVLWALTRSRRD
jgi:hypothetical protein